MACAGIRLRRILHSAVAVVELARCCWNGERRYRDTVDDINPALPIIRNIP